MKLLPAAIVLALGLTLGTSRAATINKANNADNLDLTTSWNGGVVPSTNDVAKWGSSVTGAITNSLGSNLAFGGIAITNPGGNVRIAGANTLTLGSWGLDMSGATQDLAIAATGLALAPSAGQTWTIATGRILSGPAFTRGAGASFLFDRSAGSGTLQANPATSNSIVGPWAFVRSGGTAANNSTNGTTYATTISNLYVISYTGATPLTATTAWGGMPSGGNGATNYDISSGGNLSAFGVQRIVNTIRYVGSGAIQPANISGNASTLMVLNGFLNAGTGTFQFGATNNTANLYGFTTAIGGNNEIVLNAASAGIYFPFAISNPTNGAAGAVVIAGTNAVTFSGTSTYTGNTVLAGGTLILGGAGSVRSPEIVLNGAGARLRQTSTVASTNAVTLTRGTIEGTGTLGAVTAGNGTGGIISNGSGNSSTLTIGSLTFSGAGALSLNWSGATPAIAVTGALATTPTNGQVTLSVSSGSYATGTNNLVSFGSFAGSASDFTIGTVTGLGPRQSASGLVLNGTNLALIVSGLDIVWTGATSAAWTTNAVGGTGNWVAGASPTDFINGDNVVFNDTASGNTSLDISTASIAPGVMTFSNTALNYAIGSTGGYGITGGASLVKSGNGTLTITTSNSSTGSTTLNGGRLNLGAATAIGSGAITVNGGSIDNTSGGAIAFTSNPSQAWNADFNFGGSADLNMGNGRVTLGGPGGVRVVTVPAGTLTVGGIVGTNGSYGLTKSGNGTLTLNPTALTGAVGSAVGALDVAAGWLNIGAYDLTATSLAGSGTLANGSATTRWLILSNATDNTFSGSLVNGAGAGRLGLSKSGNGTLTLSGSNAFTDTLTVASGGVLFSGTNTLGGIVVGGNLTFAPGSSSAATGAVNVGSATGVAALNIGGNTTITVPTANFHLVVANSGAQSGVVNQSGGSVYLAPTNNITIGGGTGYALYKISAGTLTQSSTLTDKVFRIGQSAGTNAVALFKQSGGAVYSGTGIAVNDSLSGTGSGGYACVYVSGGTMVSTAANVGLGIAGRAGQAEVTVDGSGVIAVTNTSLGYDVRNSGAGDGLRTGILNLGTGTSGGTLVTASIGKSSGGTNYAYMSFNGGTLKAASSSVSFLGGLDAATVYMGGATIDNNGKVIDISQALLAPVGDGIAGIAASGSGYTGAPYVQISGGGGTGASAVAHIDAGGNITSVTVTSPGFGYTSSPTVTLVGGGGTGSASPVMGAQSGGGVLLIGAGTTTLSGASSYTNATVVGAGTFLLNGSVAGDVVAQAGGTVGGAGTAAGQLTFQTNSTVYADASSAFVTASNGVVIAGPTQILFNGAPISGVAYTLFGYGNGSATGTNLLVSPYRLAFADDTINKIITATPTIGDISWSTGNGVWTNAGGTNWSGGGSFYAGDNVTFTNSPSNAIVTISGSVLPGSILVDAATSYTFTGSGSIGGSPALTKSGTGTLALANSNSFSGGITLNAGQIDIANPSALGSGGITINGGAIDNTSGGPLALATSNAQSWDGDFAFIGSGDLNMAPGAVTIGGTNDRTVTLGGGRTLTVGKITSAVYGLTLAGAGTLAITPPAAQPAGDSSIAGVLNVGAGTTFQFNTGSNAATTADIHVGGLAGSGTVINGGGVERWFLDADNVGATFTGSLQDGGAGAIGFVKSGTGTAVLAGSNNVGARFTAGGGMLVIAGPNGSTNYNYAYIDANSTMVLAHTNALGAQRLIRFSGSSSALVLETDVAGTENNIVFGTTTTATVVADRFTPGAAITHYLGTETNGNGLGGGTLTVAAGPNVTSGTPRVVFSQFNLGAGSVQTTTINPTTANVTVSNSWKGNNNVSQTLGLGGTASDNYVAGTIANGAVLTGTNTVSVVKSDSSTWYLTGTNTYTGPTTVTGGSLYINGNNNAATNEIGITGGTLGGSGSVGGNITISGATIAPGATASNIATLTCLGAVVGDVSSTLAFQVAGSGSSDALSAVGGLTFFGTVNVTFDPGYTPVSGDTFDFVAGAISGSPTLNLPVLSNSLSWVTNDFLATGALSITNTNSPVPTNAYAVWLTNYPAVGTFTNMTDDPDGDGYNNGKEFAFDGNPTAGTPALLKGTKTGTNVVFSFVANNSTFPTNYTVQSSLNLTNGASWTNNAPVTATISNAADQSGVLLTNTYTRKEFTVPVSGTQYFRVHSTLP